MHALRATSLPDPEVVTYIRSGKVNMLHFKKVDIPLDKRPACQPDWNYSYYSNRLNTFVLYKWNEAFHSPIVLARLGYYYMGDRNILKCALCNLEVERNLFRNEIKTWHKINYPACKQRTDEEDSEKYQLPECVGDISKNGLLVYKFIYFEAINQAASHCHYPTFTSVMDRYNSFKQNNKCRINCNKTRSLSQSGFFFKGTSGDVTTCFCCNKTLLKWTKDDDPWTEHAIYSPWCHFLRLYQGNLFVYKSLLNMSSSRPEVCKQIVQTNFRDYYECQNLAILNSWNEDFAANAIADRQDTGLMESFYPHSVRCKICLVEKVETIFLHCHHVISCVSCAVANTTCGICRNTLDLVLRVFVCTEEKDVIVDADTGLTDLAPHETDDLKLCKVCGVRDVSVVYIPCRHVHSCYRCAAERKDCSKCNKKYFALIEAFMI